MEKVTISEREKKCLVVLAEDYGSESNCRYMRSIAEDAGLTIVQVRRSVRSLARKGLAEYVRGLFDLDGMVAGSGYCATYEGALFVKACIDCKKEIADMVDGRCENCWRTNRDTLSKSVPPKKTPLQSKENV